MSVDEEPVETTTMTSTTVTTTTTWNPTTTIAEVCRGLNAAELVLPGQGQNARLEISQIRHSYFSCNQLETKVDLHKKVKYFKDRQKAESWRRVTCLDHKKNACDCAKIWRTVPVFST